jgi:hypothetical protein
MPLAGPQVRPFDISRRTHPMKSLAIRALASAMVAALAVLLLIGATAPAKPVAPKGSAQVVLLGTTDVKGKTSPCG